MSVMADFSEHLKTFSVTNGVSVAWENAPYEPPYETYLEAFLLPGMTTGIGVNFDSSNVSRGVYQIDVIGLIDSGWGEVMDMVELVSTHFKRGIIGDCKVESVSAGPGIKSGNRYKVPVSVNYVVITKE